MGRNTSDELAVTLRTLYLDASAARAITVLADRGIPAILLKGRVTAEWLYRHERRDYRDIDILVPPSLRDQAFDVLGEIGYRNPLRGAAPSEYGPLETVLLDRNGACIDLHHGLLGVRRDPESSWEVLSAHRHAMTVGGVEVSTLDLPARAMHLALHSAQNGPVDTRAAEDLHRGLSRVSPATWRSARGLANSLDAIESFGAGLRTMPAGATLADRLGVPARATVSTVLRTMSAPQEALQLERFIELPSAGERLRLAGRKIWPTRIYMQHRFSLARHGVAGLLVARLARLVGLPLKVVVAAHSVRTARRAVEEHPDSPENPIGDNDARP